MEVWIVMTVGDIFAGGGGWSLGAIAAGLEPIWAIENDPSVAETYAANIGQHVIVEQAQSVDIRRLDAPDVLLASPPCQQWSQGRSKKLPKRADAEIGKCVLDYIRILNPRFVFIENVEQWKNSKSFKDIFNELHKLNYWTTVQVLNAADFGVPQTRRRLILRASREGMLPALPLPVAWRGWYQAIEDLIDGLPESRFASWQIARLPKEVIESVLVGNGDMWRPIVKADEPSPSVTAHNGARAFIATVQGEASDIKYQDEPSPTITSAHGAAKYRAFIVRSSDQRENCDIARPQDDPIWTLTEGNTAHGRVKAFIVDGKPNDMNTSVTLPQGDAPMFGVVAQHGGRQAVRAFIVGDQQANDGKGVAIREASEPALTTDTKSAGHSRAWLDSGRVIAMSPRALARFQSFPDEYELPDKQSLACKIIGNAVAPLFAQRLLEGLK